MNCYSHKLLITGGNGQIATSLAKLTANSSNILFCDKKRLDITSENSIRNVLQEYRPDVIINTAAYTAVDQAENEADLAFKVNANGIKKLGYAANDFGIKLIHLSTDYVFDGQQQKPYVETDACQPINQYGLSKLEGEKQLLEQHENAIVLRVSAVFSAHGSNFVRNILRAAKNKPLLQVINDQFTCPTYAGDIAAILLRIAEADILPGVYHYCSGEVTSWHAFAETIFAEAAKLAPEYHKKIDAISTQQYASLAKRPLYSVLCNDKISQALQIKSASWRVSLPAVLQELRNANEL